MTRITGPNCAVMCNFINTHKHRHMSTVDVPIYRTVVARPKRTGKQGKPVYRHVPVNRYLFTGTCRYTGENARTCTRSADVSPQTSIWRVCVSPAVVVACNYSIISARVLAAAAHGMMCRQVLAGMVVLSLSWHNSPAAHLVPAPSETCWFRGMSVGGSFRRV